MLLSLIFATTAFSATSGINDPAFGSCHGCWECCYNSGNSYDTCMKSCGSRGVAREARMGLGSFLMGGEEAFTCNQCMACKSSNCHQGAQDAICKEDMCLEKCGTCFFEELCGDLSSCDACMADGRCVFDAAAGQCLFGASMTSRASWISKENSFSWSIDGNMDFTSLVFDTADCPAETTSGCPALSGDCNGCLGNANCMYEEGGNCVEAMTADMSKQFVWECPARSARQAGPIENYCEGNDCGEGMVCADPKKDIFEVGSCYPGYCECQPDPANNARSVNDRLDSLLNKLERAVDGSQRQPRGDWNCYNAKRAAGVASGTAAFTCGFGRRR